MSNALKKLTLAGLSGGLALVTKNLLELDQIQAEFAADTGATAEEAERAGKAINAMAGRNLQPMREIGRALGKVHTDLGLTGDAAETTAEQFLKFARVTKRDAAEEVVAFDDILDAFGKTADDIPGIMDQLIASHQKYGGSIAENEAALASMAPQLQALGADLDDGIALLNLFAASGLDASQATRALNTAVKNLKPGENLDDLVARISAIEDPTLRAQAAMKLFGTRGGAGLANALKPGIDSLDDFAVSADEAAGSTLEASSALDNTFSARVQLAIKGVTAKITEFGAAFGPALTGLASLVSLGAALGLDKVIAAAFAKVAATPAVVAAVRAAGGALGVEFGLAFVAELLALPALVMIGEEIKKRIESGLGQPLLGQGLKENLEKQGPATYFLWFKIGEDGAQAIADGFSEGMATGAPAAAAAAQAEIDKHPLAWKLGKIEDDLDVDAIARGAEAVRKAVAEQAGAMAQELAAGGANLATVSAELAAKLPDAVRQNQDEVRHQAVLSMVAFAAGLRDKRAQIEAAVEQLNDDIENTLSSRQERIHLQGVLAGQNITDGLKSTDPIVRAQAQGTVALVSDRLKELGVDASTLGGQAGQNYADALSDTKPLVTTAANTMAGGATTTWERYKKSGYSWGYGTGKAYADGLRATFGLVNDAAYYVGKGVGPLKPSSPPPAVPWIVDAGHQLGALWAKGIASAVGLARGAAATLAGGVSGLQLAPSMSLAGAVSVPSAGAVGLPTLSAGVGPAAVAGKHIEYHIHAEGQLKVPDPLAAANLLARFQGQGMLPEGD